MDALENKAMTPPRQPSDAPERVARGPRTATPLNLLVVLASVFILVVWLITLQRIAFEREQALAAEMKANASLAIAFEQQVSRALKAAEQVAAFVREQYRLQGRAIDLRRWVEEGVIREEMFTIISVVVRSFLVLRREPSGHCRVGCVVCDGV